MDRLVIESILAEADHIQFDGAQPQADSSCALILGFKAAHTDQVILAFQELKKISEEISLLVCHTQVQGIYDLEIQTAALDEPVRILNKSIPAEALAELKEYLNHSNTLVLGSNVSQKDAWITLRNVEIKVCEP